MPIGSVACTENLAFNSGNSCRSLVKIDQSCTEVLIACKSHDLIYQIHAKRNARIEKVHFFDCRK